MKNESPTPSEEKKRPKNPFWHRIIAFIIDLIILALTGFLVALVGESFFVSLGTHGILVGWFITTIYYGFFNSELGKCQTPGKRLMNLKVTKYNGDSLSLKEGIIRSLLFTTPIFLLDYSQNFFSSTIITSIISTVMIAYYVGLVYFFIVNPDGRTVHDILAKTIVHLEYDRFQNIVPISKLKLYIYSGIVLLILGGFATLYITLDGRDSAISEIYLNNQDVLLEISSDVSQIESVNNVETTSININSDSEVGIIVKASTNTDLDNEKADEIYNEILDILSSKKFNLNRIDYTSVTLKYGYDIGIANNEKHKTWKRTNE